MTDFRPPEKTRKDPFENQEFNRLFDELYTPLCRYCMKFTGDKVAAEDIVQEQFIYLWEHRLRFKEVNSISSYLYVAVKHRSISYLKRLAAKIHQNPDSVAEIKEDKLPDPEKLLENKELGEIIEKALESLPNQCKAIFTMKKFGEMSSKEIAGKLNLSVKTVEAQMTIAYKKLSSFIARNWLMFIFFI